MNKTRVVMIITAAGVLVALSMLWPAVIDQNSKPTQTIWTRTDSLAFARDRIEVFASQQFACLSNLWGKESAWDPKAHNPVKVMGKYAGGIPQMLGMSNKTEPPLQIERGLQYIYYKYQTPCNAWHHWLRKGWY